MISLTMWCGFTGRHRAPALQKFEKLVADFKSPETLYHGQRSDETLYISLQHHMQESEGRGTVGGYAAGHGMDALLHLNGRSAAVGV